MLIHMPTVNRKPSLIRPQENALGTYQLCFVYLIVSSHRHMYIYNIQIHRHHMSRTGTRKERRERGSIRWVQSGSTEARSVGALCIWQVEY